jgi:CheY-like chemotaxis protein
MPEKRFASIPLDELNGRGLHADSTPIPPLVLVVDDEPIIADTLALILKREGFAAFAAYGAEGALEIASVATPDLLLSDVVMPGMNGIELAIEIRKEVPDCRVVLLSGQALTMSLLVEYPDLAEQFTLLAKPIYPGELIRELSRLGLSNFPEPEPALA